MKIKIHKIAVPKQALLNMGERERLFFLLAGHFANEMMILATQYLITTNANWDANLHGHAATTQRLFVLKTIVGKLHEGWVMIQKYYYGGKGELCRDYAQVLSEDTLNKLAIIKRCMKPESSISKIRNQFSFHYGHKDVEVTLKGLDRTLDTIQDGDELNAYVSPTLINSLYYFSETTVNGLMLHVINPKDPGEALKKITDDVNKVMSAMLLFLNGFMAAVITRHLKDERRKAAILELEVPHIDGYEIPYFVEIPTGAADAEGDARPAGQAQHDFARSINTARAKSESN